MAPCAFVALMILQSGEPMLTGEELFRAGVEARHDATVARPIFQKAQRQLWRERRSKRDFLSFSASDELADGNLWYLVGDLPQAIQTYRWALWIAPGDPDLIRALEYARSQVAIPVEAESVLRAEPIASFAGGWLTVRRTLVPSVVGWLLFFPAFMYWQFFRGRRSVFVGAIGLGLMALVFVAGALETDYRSRDDECPSLVLVRDSVLRQGNGDEYPPRLGVTLPRGLEARQLAKRTGWVQIQLASGPVGWVPAENILRVFDTPRF